MRNNTPIPCYEACRDGLLQYWQDSSDNLDDIVQSLAGAIADTEHHWINLDTLLGDNTKGQLEYYLVADQAQVSGCYAPEAASLAIPDEVEGYPVTGFGPGAFSHLEKLERIILPSGLVEIGGSCFAGCSQLKQVHFGPNLKVIGNQAFKMCAITELNCPDSLTALGYGAFMQCDRLKVVKLGANLSSIGGACFRGCSSLETVSLSPSLTRLGALAFFSSSLHEVNLPNSLTELEPLVFAACYKLKTVRLPDNLTSIGRQAFANCRNLDEVVWPANLQCIEAGAFSRTGFSSLELPQSLQALESHAFGNCPKLKTVSAALDPTAVDEQAFSNCPQLVAHPYQTAVPRTESKLNLGAAIYHNQLWPLLHLVANFEDLLASSFGCAGPSLWTSLGLDHAAMSQLKELPNNPGQYREWCSVLEWWQGLADRLEHLSDTLKKPELRKQISLAMRSHRLNQLSTMSCHHIRTRLSKLALRLLPRAQHIDNDPAYTQLTRFLCRNYQVLSTPMRALSQAVASNSPSMSSDLDICSSTDSAIVAAFFDQLHSLECLTSYRCTFTPFYSVSAKLNRDRQHSHYLREGWLTSCLACSAQTAVQEASKRAGRSLHYEILCPAKVGYGPNLSRNLSCLVWVEGNLYWLETAPQATSQTELIAKAQFAAKYRLADNRRIFVSPWLDSAKRNDTKLDWPWRFLELGELTTVLVELMMLDCSVAS